MRELAEREGIDLAASYAYSDSESDLPMLRAVGHPVVVNPDPDLRRIAAEEGWEVLHLDRLGRRLKVLAALGAGPRWPRLGEPCANAERWARQAPALRAPALSLYNSARPAASAAWLARARLVDGRGADRERDARRQAVRGSGTGGTIPGPYTNVCTAHLPSSTDHTSRKRQRQAPRQARRASSR